MSVAVVLKLALKPQEFGLCRLLLLCISPEGLGDMLLPTAAFSTLSVFRVTVDRRTLGGAPALGTCAFSILLCLLLLESFIFLPPTHSALIFEEPPEPGTL